MAAETPSLVRLFPKGEPFMKLNSEVRRSVLRAAAASLLTVTGLGGVSVGCLNRPVEPIEPRTTSTIVERLVQSSVDKIDILLAIDNSRSMADKQNILIKAVPDLVKGLVNPKCVNDDGVVAAKQPTDPTQDCAAVSGAGFKRDFQPVLDIHIGVVTSSLGGHGGDACPDQVKDNCDTDVNRTNNDHGHLVARADVYAKGTVPTYANKGFLAWDPSKKLNPPGETNIDSLNTNLTSIVTGLGQIGCGFESQLEGWYRFLVDPEPYASISVVGGKSTPKDIDKPLLQQRADFLRSDSLLAIIMLTDENDTSIKEYGQYYLAAQLENPDKTPFHLPRARSECAKNPNDPCCKSCGQSQGNCAKDPTCDKGNLDDTTDPINLRGWDNKRRFGIDFLYPVDRYVQALTNVQVQNRAGELVPNPIFSNLNPSSNSGVRDSSLVFVAGIIGVPWQDIARTNDKGQPDLLTGVDSNGKAVGGFKNSDELSTKDPKSNLSRWDIILGAFDGSDYQPKDPLMKQDINPRTGQNPVTGDALQPAGSAVGANPINGHEHEVDVAGDLQYACIFPLLKGSERDCTKSCVPSCDCQDKANKNPLCDPNPGDSGNPTQQTRAKAYPGLRELGVLQGVGTNGIVGSICPKQLDDESKADFGYRPAIGAIIDRLKVALGGQCLPRTLVPDKEGHVPCLILEARKTGGKCNCKDTARQEVSEDHKAAVSAAQQDPIAAASGWDCFCEITQTSGAQQTACQNDQNDPPVAGGKEVDGWCYIDATTTPITGNPKIVDKCPATEKRIVRFVGKGSAQPGATLFITCSQ
jgi:hypothetical protein